MDLRKTLTAPKFRRKISIQKGETVVWVEQTVEDFMPARTVIWGKQPREIEHHLTLGHIRDTYVAPGPASCVVYLKDDLQVVFLDLDAPERLKIVDQRYSQQTEVAEKFASLTAMQIEEAVKTAESAYLKNSRAFSDPYQHEDPRLQPISFKTGSEEELRSRITDLFHSFPKLFEAVPQPTVFVYTEFDDTPASFNVHLSRNGHQLQAENYLLSLVKQIVRENTPQGYCYRGRTGQLERRSDFHKDSLFISITPTAPTSEQIGLARRNTFAVFEKYQLTLNAELFEQAPVQSGAQKAARSGN